MNEVARKALFTSERGDWRTPREYFNRLNDEFRFTLDAAASADNALCENYFDSKGDALTRPWVGRVYCNPPYGRDVGRWLAHASLQQAEVIAMLLPARTDTAWFHKYALKASEIRFIEGRLYFDDGDGRAPFPSMLVVWL